MKQYSASLKRWWEFCQNLGQDPFDARTDFVLGFLSGWFKEGAAYGTLNSARAAISLILAKPLSDEPVISRFFKGVFRLKPALPKYSKTWNSEIVLKEAAKMEPLDTLSITKITEKLVILLAMGTGHRVQTFSLINIDHINIDSSGVEINIVDLIKTSRPGSAQPNFFIPFFVNNPSVCLARVLSRYIKVTESLRGSEKKLILTINKPHRAATAQTICRWLKGILARCDLSDFSAHSTRHAATSTAFKKGINLNIIKNTVGWSENSKVFAKFYNRPIVPDKGVFAAAVLDRPIG